MGFFGTRPAHKKKQVSHLGVGFFGIGPWLSSAKETHHRQLKRPNDGSEITLFGLVENTSTDSADSKLGETIIAMVVSLHTLTDKLHSPTIFIYFVHLIFLFVISFIFA